ncbi:uncharacterized protein Dvar_80500 [Desulfosarcina variabilis str. Montpellier]|uniref:hypothetical protein n=1 Tax=Desulfosarcina variabilis TaxID=2300 RepID=UPI003AFB4D7C
MRIKKLSRSARKKQLAYENGRKVAQKWIKIASPQEIEATLKRGSAHQDTNYFASMRNIFFNAIEKQYPDETRDVKIFNTMDFMNGWREGVISIYDANKIGN